MTKIPKTAPSSTAQSDKIDRLTMAEVVLDSLLTVLTAKKIVTRDEIQEQIIKQAQEDSNE